MVYSDESNTPSVEEEEEEEDEEKEAPQAPPEFAEDDLDGFTVEVHVTSEDQEALRCAWYGPAQELVHKSHNERRCLEHMSLTCQSSADVDPIETLKGRIYASVYVIRHTDMKKLLISNNSPDFQLTSDIQCKNHCINEGQLSPRTELFKRRLMEDGRQEALKYIPGWHAEFSFEWHNLRGVRYEADADSTNISDFIRLRINLMGTNDTGEAHISVIDHSNSALEYMHVDNDDGDIWHATGATVSHSMRRLFGDHNK